MENSTWIRWAQRQPGKDHAQVEAEVLEWFDRTHDRLVRYLLRLGQLNVEDAEDVVQEVFVALYRHLSLNRSRENLGAWLFQVTHNLGLKKAAALRLELHRNVILTAESEQLAVDRAPNPEERIVQQQTALRLQAVVRALTDVEQQCISLRAEGLRYREIAKALGISLGAVSKSIERALSKLARAAGRSL